MGTGQKEWPPTWRFAAGKGAIKARPRKISPNSKFGLFHDVRTFQRLCWGSAYGRGDDFCVLTIAPEFQLQRREALDPLTLKGLQKERARGQAQGANLQNFKGRGEEVKKK